MGLFKVSLYCTLCVLGMRASSDTCSCSKIQACNGGCTVGCGDLRFSVRYQPPRHVPSHEVCLSRRNVGMFFTFSLATSLCLLPSPLRHFQSGVCYDTMERVEFLKEVSLYVSGMSLCLLPSVGLMIPSR